MPPLRRLAALLVVLPVAAASLGGCRSVGELFQRDALPLFGVDVESVDAHVAAAEAEIERGELGRALERLTAVRVVQNITPETRLYTEALIERATGLLLERAGDDLDVLEELWLLDLSPRMRAIAGIRYAERLAETGSRVSAWKQVRDVEATLPNHPERARAGAVLAQVGLDMIADPGRYYLMLRYDTRGAAALEFLVLQYPLDPACDQAYAALATHYEEESEYELAIARNEDLFTYHARSPLAVRALAEIPRLRLRLIDEPDHDRGEILRALDETDAWLLRYPDHPHRDAVEATRVGCHRALAESDLVLSRYYERIDNGFGARLHAGRALEEANRAEDQALAAEARLLIEDLGPEPIATEQDEQAP